MTPNIGMEPTHIGGQSAFALPLDSDVDLLRLASASSTSLLKHLTVLSILV